ncbi:Desiccation-like protein [Citrus sinensis]|nr:Desiccation-like protein [Citrus sinensis]
MQRRRGQPAIRSKLGAFRSRALSGGRIRLWPRQGCSILKSLVALLQLGLEANLDNLTRAIITEFGYQEVGHLRALKTSVGGIQRPLMDLSAKSFAKLIDEAFGFPPGSSILPLPRQPKLYGGFIYGALAAGLLSPESGQDRIVRGYLFGRADQIVKPYNYTVARFTTRISNLRNRLGMCGIKDEGLFVPPQLGAESQIGSNVLSLGF